MLLLWFVDCCSRFDDDVVSGGSRKGLHPGGWLSGHAVLHAIPRCSNHYKMRNTVSTTRISLICTVSYIDIYIYTCYICIYANIWWSETVIKMDFRQSRFFGWGKTISRLCVDWKRAGTVKFEAHFSSLRDLNLNTTKSPIFPKFSCKNFSSQDARTISVM